MRDESAQTSIAIATLLRLADAALHDAAVVEVGRNPVNAPALAGYGVACMLDAVVASETGWRSELGSALDAIPEQNPVKGQLASLQRRLPSLALPRPSQDGKPPPAPDLSMLGDAIRSAEAMLRELGLRFEVDLSSDGRAGTIAPLRPEPPAPLPVSPMPTISPRPDQPVREPARSTLVQGEPKLSAGPTLGRKPARVQPPSPVIVGKKPEPLTSPHAEPSHAVQGRSAIQLRTRSAGIASTAFWSLMDRWQVTDTEALDLIGHGGGLTKKGTRPRFKLVGGEVDAFLGLQEIDAAMAPLQLDAAAWLRKPTKGDPFGNATPLEFMTRSGMTGIRSATRFMLQSGLKLSVSAKANTDTVSKAKA